MADSAPRVEPQYLQAAAGQAASYYQAIWQKMGYILAIQYGRIAAAYVLRSTYFSAAVILVSFIFCWGLVWAAEHDIRSREILIAQVNYIARGLDVFMTFFITRIVPYSPGRPWSALSCVLSAKAIP
jgi:hypothetical protein